MSHLLLPHTKAVTVLYPPVVLTLHHCHAINSFLSLSDFRKLFLRPQLRANESNAATACADCSDLHAGTVCNILHHLSLTGRLPCHKGQSVFSCRLFFSLIWCYEGKYLTSENTCISFCNKDLCCVPSWKKYCSKVILENVLSPIWWWKSQMLQR